MSAPSSSTSERQKDQEISAASSPYSVQEMRTLSTKPTSTSTSILSPSGKATLPPGKDEDGDQQHYFLSLSLYDLSLLSTRAASSSSKPNGPSTSKKRTHSLVLLPRHSDLNLRLVSHISPPVRSTSCLTKYLSHPIVFGWDAENLRSIDEKCKRWWERDELEEEGDEERAQGSGWREWGTRKRPVEKDAGKVWKKERKGKEVGLKAVNWEEEFQKEPEEQIVTVVRRKKKRPIVVPDEEMEVETLLISPYRSSNAPRQPATKRRKLNLSFARPSDEEETGEENRLSPRKRRRREETGEWGEVELFYYPRSGGRPLSGEEGESEDDSSQKKRRRKSSKAKESEEYVQLQKRLHRKRKMVVMEDEGEDGDKRRGKGSRKRHQGDAEGASLPTNPCAVVFTLPDGTDYETSINYPTKTCHGCATKTNIPKLICPLCTARFCIRCMARKHEPWYVSDMLTAAVESVKKKKEDATWILWRNQGGCMKCVGVCICAKCRTKRGEETVADRCRGQRGKAKAKGKEPKRQSTTSSSSTVNQYRSVDGRIKARVIHVHRPGAVLPSRARYSPSKRPANQNPLPAEARYIDPYATTYASSPASSFGDDHDNYPVISDGTVDVPSFAQFLYDQNMTASITIGNGIDGVGTEVGEMELFDLVNGTMRMEGQDIAVSNWVGGIDPRRLDGRSGWT
ncbi:hypothetical protein BT69DRAFT_1336854 [Atractiella rhizophila]|nr:hypothetical protein BT69DRAFT_1336854 [Atractiella rhizophila]